MSFGIAEVINYLGKRLLKSRRSKASYSLYYAKKPLILPKSNLSEIYLVL